MSLTLNKEKLILTSIGALMIIAGIVTKNSATQLKMVDNWVEMLGAALFVVGWLVVAYSVAGMRDIKKTWLTWTSIIAIVVSVFMMMIAKKMKMSPKIVWPVLFIFGWLIFAYEVGKRNKVSLTLSVVSAVVVFLSMMYFLPMQRDQCVVDGPGFALFTIAWAGIVFANSLRL